MFAPMKLLEAGKSKEVKLCTDHVFIAMAKNTTKTIARKFASMAKT